MSLTKNQFNQIDDDCRSIYNRLHSLRLDLGNLAKGDGFTEDDKEFFGELESTVSTIAGDFGKKAIEFSETEDEIDDLYEKNETLMENSIPLKTASDEQKNAILLDLAANCSVEELEALEYLMRMKKDVYISRVNLPHKDNIDMNLVSLPVVNLTPAP